MDQQPQHSARAILTRLLSIPSNRSCADCRSALIDSSQVHASYSPKVSTMAITPTVQQLRPEHHFLRHHHAFAPSNGNNNNNQNPASSSIHISKIPPLDDLPVDPAIAAAGVIPHGVFVCGMCAAAHNLLGKDVCIVKAVQDVTAWDATDALYLASLGGNQRANLVLEAQYHPITTMTTTTTTAMGQSYHRLPRPTASSSIADRLTFIRAKYEALAFVLPEGPLATDAWGNIVQQHPEWKGLWGADLLELDRDAPNQQQLQQQGSIRDMLKQTFVQRKSSELPNRLVDYFCTVTPSEYLDPSVTDLTNATYPEDILLSPKVADCFPPADEYDDEEEIPEHIATFVFPEGCRASSVPLPPTFFTLVLTNSTGDRLYGGVLRIYDDDRDTVSTLKEILNQSRLPIHRRPKWLTDDNSSPSCSDVMFMPKCLVILSHYPFFDLWRNFLLHIYRIALTEAPLPIERFVANFVCEVPLPPPGKVQVKFGFTVKDSWTISRPPENQLPMANFSYRPLFTCLSVSNVLVVMACLLQETRVALLSKHYALLGPVAEALLSFLFPLHWQGMYLPIMPYSMAEILDAPVPFLVGLHSRYLTETPASKRPHGVVFVDLDRDEVHLGFEDPSGTNESNHMTERLPPSIPERHAAKLKAKLIEFASIAYVVPETDKIGIITTGADRPLSNVERELYAQPSAAEVPCARRVRRKEIFQNVDKAYNENELIEPISGFLGEHGQLYESSAPDAVSTKKKKPLAFVKKIVRGKSLDSSVHSQRNLSSHYSESETMESLLDINEPTGFSANDIREAFLRFFVSLFQDYRLYIKKKTFQQTEFVASFNFSKNVSDFISSITKTQMFQSFITERIYHPIDPEVLFFDESIKAKLNRSKMNIARKQETAFLNDTTQMVTETYAPPPPSNWGLQSDKRYHYATFPPLDPDLFGKIRRPIEWNDSQRRRSFRMKRRSSAIAQANEQAVIEKASKSVLKKYPKRGVRNLESALLALSRPFSGAPRRTASLDRSLASPKTSSIDDHISVASELTLPSSFFLSPGDISSAEEYVLNARRKQTILLQIIVKLQAYCRMFLVKNGNSKARRSRRMTRLRESMELSEKHSCAAMIIQSSLRAHHARKRFSLLMKAVVWIQVRYRGRLVRLAFEILRTSASKVQSTWRGFRLREGLSILQRRRMMLYKLQIFRLWQYASTPLSFRAKLWEHLRADGYVRVAIAEEELLRLWNQLDIRISESNWDAVEELKVCKRLGIPIGLHGKALKVDEMLNRKSVRLSNSTAKLIVSRDRVAAEKTQVYERLSHLDSRLLAVYFERFKIPMKEKKKKAALAECIWKNYADVDNSTEFMLEIFPELKESTNINFIAPSKKSLRRFPSVIPSHALEKDMWSHSFYIEKVRRDVHEVAAAFFRRQKIRQISITCFESRRKSINMRQYKTVVASRGGRDAIVKQVFWNQAIQKPTAAESHFTKPNGVTAKKSSVIATEAVPEDEAFMDSNRPVVFEQQYWVRQ